jgi:NifU-like protein involved in Fe-S cluster formation
VRGVRLTYIIGTGGSKGKTGGFHQLGRHMADLNEIYNSRLLELAAHIPHSQRLADPDATVTAHSKLCGSTVSIDLNMQGDRATGYGQTVKACLLGQAACAIMGAHIIGASAAELRETAAAMRRMLKENGAPPTGRFADLAILEPVRHYKARHGSVMLVFDAIERAIDEIEGKRAAATAGAASA